MQPNWQVRAMESGVQDLGRSQAFSFPDMIESAIAGVSAALVATAILGIAKLIHRWWARHRDVIYIRDILIDGQAYIFKAEGFYHEGISATSPADRLRAAQYNNMIKKLRVALEQWAVNLSHAQRRDVFDALDWFHTKGLLAFHVKGEMEYVQVPDGNWPTREMSVEAAQKIFEDLQSIKWLKFKRR